MRRHARLSMILVLALHAAAPQAVAHGDKPHDVHDLLRTWGWEPGVLISLALSAWLYVRGLCRLWRAAGVGHGIRRWEAWCYAGGWFALFVALVSPLHPWGRVLFSAHMTQHEVLMLVAAPLLVLGRPLIVLLKALPAPTAHGLASLSNTSPWQSTWRAISNPFTAWLIHGVILWIWHVPAFFEATIDDEFVHTLQHASFLFSAILFWWAVTHGRARRAAYGMAILYLFTTALHSGLLGLLITFARSVWYPAYAGTTQSWGLTSLEDQQLGGLIMWIPAGLVYVVAGLAFFAGLLRESEARVRRREAESSFSLAPTVATSAKEAT
jgi:putative membrane protein